MHADSDSQFAALGPVVLGDRPLDVDGGRHGIRGPVECEKEGVALGVNDIAIPARDGRLHDVAVRF